VLVAPGHRREDGRGSLRVDCNVSVRPQDRPISARAARSKHELLRSLARAVATNRAQIELISTCRWTRRRALDEADADPLMRQGRGVRLPLLPRADSWSSTGARVGAAVAASLPISGGKTGASGGAPVSPFLRSGGDGCPLELDDHRAA